MNRSVVAGVGKACLAILALLPLGCSKHSAAVLDLHRSELVTPAGRVPFELGTEEHLSSLRENRGQLLVATYEDLMVVVGVLPRRQSLMIDSTREAHEVAPVDGQSFYQLNGGDHHPVDLQPEAGDRPPRRQTSRLGFDLPPPLSVEGDGEAARDPKRRELRKDDVHTLYLSFLVDGKPFAVDLEFGVEIETVRVFAAPATP